MTKRSCLLSGYVKHLTPVLSVLFIAIGFTELSYGQVGCDNPALTAEGGSVDFRRIGGNTDMKVESNNATNATFSRVNPSEDSCQNPEPGQMSPQFVLFTDQNNAVEALPACLAQVGGSSGSAMNSDNDTFTRIDVAVDGEADTANLNLQSAYLLEAFAASTSDAPMGLESNANTSTQKRNTGDTCLRVLGLADDDEVDDGLYTLVGTITISSTISVHDVGPDGVNPYNMNAIPDGSNSINIDVGGSRLRLQYAVGSLWRHNETSLTQTSELEHRNRIFLDDDLVEIGPEGSTFKFTQIVRPLDEIEFSGRTAISVTFIVRGNNINGIPQQHDIDYTVTADIELELRDIVRQGDLNGDGVRNLLDVQPFVDAITAGKFIPEADMNGDGQVNLADVARFVELLGQS